MRCKLKKVVLILFVIVLLTLVSCAVNETAEDIDPEFGSEELIDDNMLEEEGGAAAGQATQRVVTTRILPREKNQEDLSRTCRNYQCVYKSKGKLKCGSSGITNSGRLICDPTDNNYYNARKLKQHSYYGVEFISENGQWQAVEEGTKCENEGKEVVWSTMFSYSSEETRAEQGKAPRRVGCCEESKCVSYSGACRDSGLRPSGRYVCDAATSDWSYCKRSWQGRTAVADGVSYECDGRRWQVVAQGCFDDDLDNDPHKVGTVTNGKDLNGDVLPAQTDSCTPDGQLEQIDCAYNEIVDIEGVIRNLDPVDCPGSEVCRDGQCIAACIDSDRGGSHDQYAVAGHVIDEGEQFDDSCETTPQGESFLREWRCNAEGRADDVTINCDYGCEEGACKPAPIELDSCATLDQEGATYTVDHLEVVNHEGTCFAIGANDVTLDCQDSTITVILGDTEWAVSAQNQNDFTVQNCNFVGFRNGVKLSTGSAIRNSLVVAENVANPGIGIETRGTNPRVVSTTVNGYDKGIMSNGNHDSLFENTIINNRIGLEIMNNRGRVNDNRICDNAEYDIHCRYDYGKLDTSGSGNTADSLLSCSAFIGSAPNYYTYQWPRLDIDYSACS
jgi:hypothetical protein